MSEHDCTGDCEHCAHAAEEKKEDCRLGNTLARIGRKIVVMSGKGGVGKSTVAVNLAMALAKAGKSVGLLDIDIHGPSVPTMLHLEEARIGAADGRILPVEAHGIKVVSLGFLLDSTDSAGSGLRFNAAYSASKSSSGLPAPSRYSTTLITALTRGCFCSSAAA